MQTDWPVPLPRSQADDRSRGARGIEINATLRKCAEWFNLGMATRVAGSTPYEGWLPLNTEKIALAGELALGLLDKAEHERVRRDLDGDPEMREAYRYWQERFAGFYDGDDTASVTPPPRVLNDIEVSLFGEENLSLSARLLEAVRAPENRGLIVTLAVAKAALLAWILYLFL